MSDYQENEFANGNASRFDGLDEVFAVGSRPLGLGDELEALLTEAVELVRSGDEMTSTTAVDLVRMANKVKYLRQKLDAVTKEVNRRWDYLRLIAVPAKFEEEGLQNVKLADVGTVSLRGDVYASVIPAHREEAYEWLQDNGRGDLIKETVNASSLKAVLKKMLENGEEIPEDLFKATPFTMATFPTK